MAGQVLGRFFRRYFSDPQVVILAALLLVGLLAIVLAGKLLAPVFASVIIAYLLEAVVKKVEQFGVPRFPAVLIVFILFLVGLLAIIFGLVPVLTRQASQLFGQIPDMLSRGQSALKHLPEKYPDLVTAHQVTQIMDNIRTELAAMGQTVLSHSLASLISVITFTVYLVLMPLLVFFFLKDKARLVAWVQGYLPRRRELADHVWHDVDRQIGNYVRGKIWEIAIVWCAASIAFFIIGLNFAVLMGLLVGLSVLVPYVGAVIVAFPIAAIGYFQWGLSLDLLYTLLIYFGIHAVDGNILVPLLYAEVVDLHPVAIIVAVLFFGEIWGFWGVFFAIPLATLVQAVLQAWPRRGVPPVAVGPPAGAVEREESGSG